MAAVLIGGSVALALNLSQTPRYTASSQVLMGIGAPPGGANQRVDPDRINQTQAGLAETPAVAGRTLAAARATALSVDEFLASSKVESNPENDLLVFSVTDESAPRAAALATEYARQFIRKRRTLDGGSYASHVGEAFLVAPARGAVKTEPETVRNIVLGLGLGFIVGIVLVFVLEAVSPRLRSPAAVLEWLGLPLLGRLPRRPRRPLQAWRPAGASSDGLVMLDMPHGREAEPYRVLRNSLNFSNLEHGARTIMFTGAEVAEAKSPTVANVAVALARGGRDVALVDLNLRQPALDRLFGLEGRPGAFEEVSLDRYEARFGGPPSSGGGTRLDDALVPVNLDMRGVGGGERDAGDRPAGALRVLPAGAMHSDDGEFITTQEIRSLLARLRERADLVLIDGPPLVGAGDGLLVAAEVEAIVVIAEVDDVREDVLLELRWMLQTCRVPKLGVILIDVPAGDAVARPPVGRAEMPSWMPVGTNGAGSLAHHETSGR